MVTRTHLSVTLQTIACVVVKKVNVHLDEGFAWWASTRSLALTETFFETLNATHQKNVRRNILQHARRSVIKWVVD